MSPCEVQTIKWFKTNTLPKAFTHVLFITNNNRFIMGGYWNGRDFFMGGNLISFDSVISWADATI